MYGSPKGPAKDHVKDHGRNFARRLYRRKEDRVRLARMTNKTYKPDRFGLPVTSWIFEKLSAMHKEQEIALIAANEKGDG